MRSFAAGLSKMTLHPPMVPVNMDVDTMSMRVSRTPSHSVSDPLYVEIHPCAKLSIFPSIEE